MGLQGPLLEFDLALRDTRSITASPPIPLPEVSSPFSVTGEFDTPSISSDLSGLGEESDGSACAEGWGTDGGGGATTVEG